MNIYCVLVHIGQATYTVIVREDSSFHAAELAEHKLSRTHGFPGNSLDAINVVEILVDQDAVVVAANGAYL